MPSLFPPLRTRVPVVLVTTTLQKLASTWRAAALSIPDVGVAVFFIAGVATSGAGVLAPWFVAAAVLLGLACRTMDVEGWGVHIRGGLPGRAGVAFGPQAAAIAASAQLLERVLFAGLASLVFGHYVAALPMWLFVPVVRWPAYLRAEDPATVAAILLLGFTWMRARLGYATPVERAVTRTWTAVGIVIAVMLWALMAVTAAHASAVALAPVRALESLRHTPATPVGMLLAVLFAFGHALPAIGSGDSLARAVAELEPPRIRGVWRTLAILTVYAGFVTIASTFLYSAIVPADGQVVWSDVPIFGIARYLPGGMWAQVIMSVVIGASATLLLGQAARAGISGAE